MVRKGKLHVEDEKIGEVDHFCHRGSENTREVRCEKGVKFRIMEAKTQFGQLRSFCPIQKLVRQQENT